MSCKIDVSIVIVSWNTKDILRDCLCSVYENTSGLSFEVIVIDNASADASAQMVAEEFGDAVLIANTDNRGFAAANNQGMKIARGRYVLLLNSDTVVLDRAIEKMIDFADSKPKTGVAGCRVLNPDMTLQPTCFKYPSILNMTLSCSYLYKIFPKSRFFGRERMTWWNRNDTRQVDVVTGCFMLVRRSAIDRVGLMDERFLMYAEETDWCYRFRQAGWEIYYTPSAQIIHLGGQSSKQVRSAMRTEVVVSVLKFMKKHHGWLGYHLACLVFFVYFLVRLPVLTVVAISRRQKRRDALCKVRAYVNGMAKIMTGACAI